MVGRVGLGFVGGLEGGEDVRGGLSCGFGLGGFGVGALLLAEVCGGELEGVERRRPARRGSMALWPIREMISPRAS